ncbi:hypothetical protein [Actinomadura yumaensis]|uniref:Uncharacterized protein n=2 Tax=Actinomadura TaxID=1988 RepID=A0ABW2CQP2_9ACTN
MSDSADRKGGRSGQDPGTGAGASSGMEDLPHERAVLGSGSAAEGYDIPDGGDGTREGDPIAGVKVEPGEAERTPRTAE